MTVKPTGLPIARLVEAGIAEGELERLETTYQAHPTNKREVERFFLPLDTAGIKTWLEGQRAAGHFTAPAFPVTDPLQVALDNLLIGGGVTRAEVETLIAELAGPEVQNVSAETTASTRSNVVYIVNATTTFKLPAAPGSSQFITVRALGAHVVTVNGNGKKVEATTTLELGPAKTYETVTLVYDNVETWRIV